MRGRAGRAGSPHTEGGASESRRSGGQRRRGHRPFLQIVDPAEGQRLFTEMIELAAQVNRLSCPTVFVAALAESGVTTLNLTPLGADPAATVHQIARIAELADGL